MAKITPSHKLNTPAVLPAMTNTGLWLNEFWKPHVVSQAIIVLLATKPQMNASTSPLTDRMSCYCQWP